MIPIFSDLTSSFQIIDYSPTHSQLLIRSLKNRNRDYNIDVIFKGVSIIVIPSRLNGLEISEFKNVENKIYLIEDYSFKITEDYKIFSLKDSERKSYFLNAMGFGVFHNKSDILESSLDRYDYGSLGEMILWYAD